MKKSQQILFHLLCQEASSAGSLIFWLLNIILILLSKKEQWEYVHRKITKTFFTNQKYYEIATGETVLSQMGPKDRPSNFIYIIHHRILNETLKSAYWRMYCILQAKPA